MLQRDFKIENYVKSSLLLAIGFSYDTVWRDLNSRLKQENCNLLEAVILISLFFESSEWVTPSQLANLLRTSRGNISHCISRLERQGALRRILSGDDARSYRLSLRPEGRKRAVKLIKLFNELEVFFENKFGKTAVQDLVDNMRRIETAYGNIYRKNENR